MTTGTGAETDPVFSPDGQQIAFTGEYDGNVDVFVMPASGGIPKRLTWHPAADYVLGWTPDGQCILFASTRTSYAWFAELFTVGLESGFEERVPLPVGFEGAYSPDGKSLAYVPVARAFSAWKRAISGRHGYPDLDRTALRRPCGEDSAQGFQRLQSLADQKQSLFPVGP